ncbi:MAG TPA: undecaprenyl-phosphate glucose phosphotransferase [Azospirillaceae bacterium]|nr:undecaprenyl-phosphate glucose phosphotransferase [Azospirillaceae bacterium]
MSIHLDADVDSRLLIREEGPLPLPLVSTIALLIDAAVLASTAASIYWNPYFRTLGEDAPPTTLIALLVAISLASVAAFHLAGLYRPNRIRRQGLQALGVLACLGALGTVLHVLSKMLTNPGIETNSWPLAWVLSTTAAIPILRSLWAWQVRQWTAAGRFARRAVVIGLGDASARLIAELTEDKGNDIEILGVFAERDDDLPVSFAGREVLGPISRLPAFVQRQPVDDILVALPWTPGSRLTDAVRLARMLPANVRLFPDLPDLTGGRVGASSFGGVTLFDVARRPLAEWDGVVKRAEDLVIAGLLLIPILPLMALVALVVKLTSPGPVLFRQRRFGFGNRVIRVLKFRTMYVDRGDPSGAARTTRDDPRVTPVGRFLRKTSLDELPQLFNVIRGDMSIVGPRAHAVAMHVGRLLYHEAVDDYIARHRVRPGITGWAQVNGLRGEIDTMEKARKRIEYDLYYIDHWSVALDIKIIVKTVLVLFNDRNAY